MSLAPWCMASPSAAMVIRMGPRRHAVLLRQRRALPPGAVEQAIVQIQQALQPGPSHMGLTC
jgi:hypothetical protein